MENPWNSLEIVKLIIGALTPIIGGIIAWRLSKIGKDLEKKQWTDRKIIEKRLEIYEKVVPHLNDLYCFYLYVGNWKELSPKDVIKAKRFLDKNIHIYAHLFEKDILENYDAFIHHCFKPFGKMGDDAKIKSEFDNRAKHAEQWEDGWGNYFLPEEVETKETIRSSYNDLLNVFRSELQLNKKG